MNPFCLLSRKEICHKRRSHRKEIKVMFPLPINNKRSSNLEVVVSLEERARVHVGGVELVGLGTRVPVQPEEHVVLDLEKNNYK